MVSPSQAARESAANFSRARARRDMTVPIGRSSTAAMCLYERSSISRSTRISRISAGSAASAAATWRRRSPASALCSGSGPVGGPGLELLQRLVRAVARPLVDPGVAHDAQQPWPRLLAAKGVEVAQRAQHRLLRQILRRHRIARQPAREAVGGVEMRQHDGAKPLDRTAVRFRRIRHAAHRTSIPPDRRFYSNGAPGINPAAGR